MSLILEKLSGLSDRHVLKIQRPWFSSDGQREVTLGTLAEWFAANSPAPDVSGAIAAHNADPNAHSALFAEVESRAIANGLTIVTTNATTGAVSIFDLPTIPASWNEYNVPLNAVRLASGATSIGNSAFYYCSFLTSVSLPVATSIGALAFSRCSSLPSISLPAATSIGISAFYYCSFLTSVSLPVATSIGNSAFKYCPLTSVSLPVATSIGNSAFAGLIFGTTPLTSVSLPVATSIGSAAFYACNNLTSVSLPVATSIGSNAFGRCSALTSVSLPVATSIGGLAFRYCDNLTSVSLPAATSIGGLAFSYCDNLTSGVYLNAPLSGLTSDALQGSSITTIHLRPAPNTPAGWVEGAGQTIKGKSGVTVVFDWTTFPDLP
jgi:hypothetical protein